MDQNTEKNLKNQEHLCINGLSIITIQITCFKYYVTTAMHLLDIMDIVHMRQNKMKVKPLEMPNEYIGEMIADWRAADD